MRVIITASPTITDTSELPKAIRLSGIAVTYILTGIKSRIDKAVEQYAALNGIKFNTYSPKYYSDHDRGMADFIRNEKMVEMADALILIWDMDNPGVEMDHLVQEAARKNLKIFIHKVKALKVYKSYPKPDFLKMRGDENEM